MEVYRQAGWRIVVSTVEAASRQTPDTGEIDVPSLCLKCLDC